MASNWQEEGEHFAGTDGLLHPLAILTYYTTFTNKRFLMNKP
jgi:hypothetical protein